MEFLVLGGMILLMDIFKKVPVMKTSIKSLIGLKIPVGIVVFLVGIVSFKSIRLIFPAIMGLIAGFTLILDLIKMIPKNEDAMEKTSAFLTGLSIPVGILTIFAGIIGMFVK